MPYKRVLAYLLALLLALGGLSGAAVAGTPLPAGAKLAPDLAQRLLAGGRAPAIVRFAVPLAHPEAAAAAGRAGLAAPRHRFPAIQGLALDLTRAQAEALAREAAVATVELDRPVQAFLGNATRWFGAQEVRRQFGYSGAGVGIAIVDTGIDGNHMDFAGRIAGWKDLVGNQPQPYDDHGHGSHVAGIAAGSGAAAGGAYAGVAPGASLVGVKVLNSAGSGYASTIIAGVQWVIDNRTAYNIRVVNLSLGSAGNSDGKDSLSAIVNKAAEAGIIPTVAAGNAGPGAGTIGAPGTAAQAVTVANLADVSRSGFYLSPSSSRGPTADGRVKPDIGAPGTLIQSVRANSGAQYTNMSGTSMAAPFVAGTAALMLEANPSLTAGQVKDLLMQTAVDWGPSGPDTEFGAGRLDAYAAVQAAGGATGTGNIATPAHVSYTGQLAAGGSQSYDLHVTDTAYPISATLIMPDWQGAGSPNFSVSLYSPGGALLGASGQDARQDQLARTPAATGTYRVVVSGLSGSGRYYLDLSAGAGTAQPPPAPGVRIASPADGATVQGVVTIQAAVSGSSLTGVHWQVDGGPAQPMALNSTSGYWEAAWDTGAVAAGSHTVRVQATDGYGQSAGSQVTVAVSAPAPATWSSGDLEGGTWSVSGSSTATAKDYGFTPPAHQVQSAQVTVRLKSYSASSSAATDGVAPYLEVRTGSGLLIGTIRPTGPGTFMVTSSDAAVAADIRGGSANSLRLVALSLDRKGGKQNDKLTVDLFQVALAY